MVVWFYVLKEFIVVVLLLLFEAKRARGKKHFLSLSVCDLWLHKCLPDHSHRNSPLLGFTILQSLWGNPVLRGAVPIPGG